MIEVIKVKDCGEKIGDYDIPIHNAIIIPNNATNGDMIRAMFPHATIRRTPNDICLYVKGQGDAQVFDWEWWNSPYRKEQE